MLQFDKMLFLKDIGTLHHTFSGSFDNRPGSTDTMSGNNRLYLRDVIKKILS
jgi:hypothetical protein